MEIAGYRDALELIHNNYIDLQLDENTIRNLHRMIVDGRIEKIGGNRNARYRPALHDRKHQEQ